MPQLWNDILEIPEARWIVYGTLLIFAVLIAVYVSVFFRNLAIGENESDETDLLSDFRNLRDQGHLDPTEFDRLKNVIPDNARPELMRGVVSGKENTNQEPVRENEAQTKKFMTLAEAESMKNQDQETADGEDQQHD